MQATYPWSRFTRLDFYLALITSSSGLRSGTPTGRPFIIEGLPHFSLFVTSPMSVLSSLQFQAKLGVLWIHNSRALALPREYDNELITFNQAVALRMAQLVFPSFHFLRFDQPAQDRAL
jgi:hypothetical protein